MNSKSNRIAKWARKQQNSRRRGDFTRDGSRDSGQDYAAQRPRFRKEGDWLGKANARQKKAGVDYPDVGDEIRDM